MKHWRRLRGRVLREAPLAYSQDHGLPHWNAVERNARQLVRMGEPGDIDVIRLFALLHDSQRIDELDDPEHAERAFLYATELWRAGLIDLLGNQFETLTFALRWHSVDLRDVDFRDPILTATTRVCWDADRLELPRVGIPVDADRLFTPSARKLVA